MIKNLKQVNNAFDLEDYRDYLASVNEYKNFKKTYSLKKFQLKNNNTGKLWDGLNKQANFDKQSNPGANKRIEIVVQLINKVNSKPQFKLLDIGFGSGILESRLWNKYKYSIFIKGIDISDESVKKMRRLYKKWQFLKTESDKFKVKEKYDCIVALELFEHIDPDKILILLQKIHNSLSINGYLILSIPVNENLPGLLSEGKNPNAHVRTYTKNIITTELRISNFKIVKYHEIIAFKSNLELKTVLSRFKIIKRRPNNIVILAQKV